MPVWNAPCQAELCKAPSGLGRCPGSVEDRPARLCGSGARSISALGLRRLDPDARIGASEGTGAGMRRHPARGVAFMFGARRCSARPSWRCAPGIAAAPGRRHRPPGALTLVALGDSITGARRATRGCVADPAGRATASRLPGGSLADGQRRRLWRTRAGIRPLRGRCGARRPRRGAACFRFERLQPGAAWVRPLAGGAGPVRLAGAIFGGRCRCGWGAWRYASPERCAGRAPSWMARRSSRVGSPFHRTSETGFWAALAALVDRTRTIGARPCC